MKNSEKTTAVSYESIQNDLGIERLFFTKSSKQSENFMERMVN